MADDIQITAGSGTTVATDDVGAGRQVQLVKPVFGGDGVATMPDATNRFPTEATFARPTAAGLSSAQINESTSGDRTILAGTASQTVRVFKFFLENAGTAPVSIKFKDGAGADFHPAIVLQPGGSFALPFDGEPWFVTASEWSRAESLGGRPGLGPVLLHEVVTRDVA